MTDFLQCNKIDTETSVALFLYYSGLMSCFHRRRILVEQDESESEQFRE